MRDNACYQQLSMYFTVDNFRVARHSSNRADVPPAPGSFLKALTKDSL